MPITNRGCKESSKVDKLKEEMRAMAVELHAMRSFISQKFLGENWTPTTMPTSFQVNILLSLLENIYICRRLLNWYYIQIY